MESDLNQRLGKALRKLGHDCKGPTINLKMALEILPDLETPTQGAFINEMTESVDRLNLLLDEAFLLAQMPYWDLEPTNLNGLLHQFVEGLSEHDRSRLRWTTTETPLRTDLDGHRFIKLLHWWLRLHIQEAHIALAVAVDQKHGQLTLSQPNDSQPESQQRLLLTLEALAERCQGQILPNGEIQLLLPLR